MSLKGGIHSTGVNPSEAYTAETQRQTKLCAHVAMLGARQHYAVPTLFHQAGFLGKFYTDIYLEDWSWLKKYLSFIPSVLLPIQSQRLLGRSNQDLPSDRVVSFPGFGIWYWWKRHRARDTRMLIRLHVEMAQTFNRRIIRKGFSHADALFGYNSAALELLEYAKSLGMKCILEQTSAPYDIERALLTEELMRWPGWQPGMATDWHDDALSQREREEWKLADRVLGGSTFVLDGLRKSGVPDNRCRLVPYGVSLERFAPVQRKQILPSSKLRVLFVGEVGLRKGVPYLLEALRNLDSSKLEARFVGAVALDPGRLKPYRSVAEFMGPVSRMKMSELYQWADLLVAPSICEGSALVTYEALASGIPVIATPNSGSYVRDGIDGLIVPIRDVESLSAAIERFMTNREFLRFCSQNAFSGRGRLGLVVYQRRLVEVFQEVTREDSN